MRKKIQVLEFNQFLQIFFKKLLTRTKKMYVNYNVVFNSSERKKHRTSFRESSDSDSEVIQQRKKRLKRSVHKHINACRKWIFTHLRP